MTNEKWIELIQENRSNLMQTCITAFKESMLTDYTEIPLQTDVILHQDGEIYTIDHTGNSTDSDVFHGKAKVIYSVTEQNIEEDDSQEEMLDQVFQEINHKIDTAIWELKNYQ